MRYAQEPTSTHVYVYREIYIYKIYPPFPFPFKQTHVFCFFFGGQPSPKGQARSAWRRAGQPGVAGRGAHRQPPNRTLTDVFKFFPNLHFFFYQLSVCCVGGVFGLGRLQQKVLFCPLPKIENRARDLQKITLSKNSWPVGTKQLGRKPCDFTRLWTMTVKNPMNS